MKADKYLKQLGIEWGTEELFGDIWETIDWAHYEKLPKLSRREERVIVEEVFDQTVYLSVYNKYLLNRRFKLAERSMEFPQQILKKIRFKICMDETTNKARLMCVTTQDEFERMEIPRDEETVNYLMRNVESYRMKQAFGIHEPTEELAHKLISEYAEFLNDMTKKGFIQDVQNKIVKKMQKDRLNAYIYTRRLMDEYWKGN